MFNLKWPRRQRRGSIQASTLNGDRRGSQAATFWQVHNPTTRNRQGWDVGSQYRSAIFTHDADQMTAAVASRDAQQSAQSKPIVTEIEAAGPFYAAEDYHQQYFEKQGGGACAVTIEVPTSATAAGR